MLSTLDDLLGRAAARWTDAVQPRSAAVVAAFALATAAIGVYTTRNLGLNTNENDLFSHDVAFAVQRDDFYRAFPRLVDPIVLVVDGATADLAHEAASALAARLRAEPARFASVYQPGGGPFFEKYGLLYLERDELAELSDRLVEVQPYLAELARDTSVRGILSALGDALVAIARGDLDGAEIGGMLDRVTDAVEASLGPLRRPLSWRDIIWGDSSTAKERRRFVLVEPVVDYSQLRPAEGTLAGLHEVIDELGFNGLAGPSGVRVRSTGIFPLSDEESENVSYQLSLAGIASLALVTIILFIGLRSTRLVLASVATLLVGLVWTAGFAALAIGHVNLISVAFAVLFIGLSIDFAIHLCIRYAELVREGREPAAAMRGAAESLGGSLILCATTTAIGFYAFVPTDFVGVGELGLIAGTGMFISLFSNLTLLPALVTLAARARPAPDSPPLRWSDSAVLRLPVRHAGRVAAAVGVLAFGSAFLLPRVEFDMNPLRVRDPSASSVQAFNDMLADGTAFPWNVNVFAGSLDEARKVASRLEALPSVDYAVALTDFVPQNQAERLEIIEDLAFLLLPTLETDERPPPTLAEERESIEELERRIAALDPADGEAEWARSARRLGAALAAFRAGLGDDEHAGAAIGRLEASLVGSLPEQLRIVRTALTAGPVALADLPADLVEFMTATDGRMRVEVFPRGDLNDNRLLAEYVESVREIAPDAFGEGVVILEAGRVVVRSLQQALVTAGLLIALLLVVLWRSVVDASLVAIPLGLGVVFIGASSVLLGVPMNFANVIVIPLLLGMGVDSGIHLVHRSRAGALAGGNLLRTSTARAVFFSALTTVASFGTLGFSSHRGMASLGQLLTLGIALMLVCNLVVIPTLVRLAGRAGRTPPAPR